MKKLLITLIVPTILLSCAEWKTHIFLGNKKYDIPSHYIISYERSGESKEGNGLSSIVALSFSEENEFTHLTGKNGWLSRGHISVTLYDETMGDFNMTLLNKIPSDYDVFIEFDDVFRVFKEGFNSSWKALPKKGIFYDPSIISTVRILDCKAMGGVKGINASRVDKNIPTSCKVLIKRDNLLVRFSSTEENLVENFQLIHDFVFSKLDSWESEVK